jgi:hypothetical protein
VISASSTIDLDVEKSGNFRSTDFKIKNSAKMFKILSSGLYKNKIRAILREFSTNAWDSHVINGQVFQHIIKGMEVGHGRNQAVQFIMNMPKEERPKWLFFLGDDMIPPWDGLVKLYETAEYEKWDALTGMYFWKGEPPTPLIWRDDHIGRLIPGKHFNVGEVIDVDLTGLDFTLIRTSLLEKMESPWFESVVQLYRVDGTVTQQTLNGFISATPLSVQLQTAKSGLQRITPLITFAQLQADVDTLAALKLIRRYSSFLALQRTTQLARQTKDPVTLRRYHVLFSQQLRQFALDMTPDGYAFLQRELAAITPGSP